MAKPDKTIWIEMLEAAAETYPDDCEADQWNKKLGKSVANANINYLVEHNLVTGLARKRMGDIDSYGNITITSAGLDYVSQDGGLTAELGVVTIRLEAEAIQALVTAQIEMAEATRQEKNLLRQQLQALSKEGHQRLANQLIRLGLEGAPRSIEWLKTLIGS
ncbi:MULTISPECIES: hypothetical protein [unclassified Halomonas]|uniref:hypothetical protein n=1 Tax=unclassified Halomonas TaxID=2609666 RepID=UPI00209FF3D4|nr:MULTISPECIES: hypothetical protein [unclassified Halomonas]MCP1313002.1 hypothetical protein [Halomonas sp. 707D7]MCP1326097.1 hypothetical protein [Halomonas sp. 707D4]